ncbi:phage holin family protein [Paenibacillus silvisoli]|uniref:phage holin family protein n=1 Tax=Paenibacillus silvisoli TaxID=3110539 RepID=UPI0028051B43|nr:phage holin family protein [Paenibacillus silvisoli]
MLKLFFFNTASAVIGSIVTYAFGGWSALLDLLLIAVVVDYVSGLFASGKEGKLSSKVGFIGISKKLYIFLLVAVGHKIDTVIGGDIIMQGVIYFYLANEVLSITENGGRLGLPVPPIIKQAVAILKEKGGANASQDSEQPKGN